MKWILAKTSEVQEHLRQLHKNFRQDLCLMFLGSKEDFALDDFHIHSVAQLDLTAANPSPISVVSLSPSKSGFT